MRTSGYSPFSLVRLLGVKDQGETRLDGVESIQPVMIVGAGSQDVAPPIHGPMVWTGGGDVDAAGVARLCVRFRTSAPGGCLIKRLYTAWSATGASGLMWGYETVAAGLITISRLLPPPQRFQVGVGNCQATVEAGTMTPAAQAAFGNVGSLPSREQENVSAAAVSTISWHDDPFFVPAGLALTFVLDGTAAGAGMFLGALISDYPDRRAQP